MPHFVFASSLLGTRECCMVAITNDAFLAIMDYLAPWSKLGSLYSEGLSYNGI
jgi:hypothetical protein